MEKSGRLGVLLTLMAATLFGVGAPVAADFFRMVDPLHSAQLRSIGTAFIIAWLAWRRGQTNHGGRLPWLIVLGAILAAVTLSFYVAIDRLGVGPGVTIQFTAPLAVLAWMRLVQGRHVGRGAWVAAWVAILGIALVSGAYQPERLDPIGLAAAAVASLTFAGYLLVGEHLGRSLPVLTVSAYGFAFSALILLLVTDLRLPPAEPLRWLQLLWILVMGTVVPFLLEVKALQLADPGAVGVAASLEPVVGTLVAWVWLGQTLTLTQALGAALTVGGITAIQRVVARSAPLI